MSATSLTLNHERVRRVEARTNHKCWTWAEGGSPAPGEGYDGKPRCTRMIAKGETYVESTIYPGHDSGYADAGWRWEKGVRVDVPAKPVTSRFCLPCSGRWVNLRERLALLDNEVL